MNSKLTVYWDGQCPFCAALSTKLHSFDTSKRLKLVDYNDPQIAASADPRFSFEDLNREMHVAMPNGTWRIGYWAWIAVMSELPAFKWLSLIMALPIFADIGPKAYRWVAVHRLAISKLLGLPAPCDSSGACKIPSSTPSAAKPLAGRAA